MIDILGAGAMPLGNVLFSFRESILPAKIIVLILFVGSIYAWTIMITKYLELKRARDSSIRFMMSYRRQRHPIGLFLKRQKFEESPLYRIYETGCLALGGQLETGGVNTDDLFVGEMSESNVELNHQQLESIRNITDRNVSDESLLLERQMGILATAVSASPFLGLLGTVWGVMDSFSGMAVAGAATLSAVAPGIAGALLTTVVGLLVALPSAIGYNLLTQRIREIQVQMDNFAQEYTAALQTAFMRTD